MIRSWVCSSSAALVTDIPGSDTGMNSKVPSSRSGANSEPSRIAGQMPAAKTATARKTVAVGARSTRRMIGR